MDDSTNKTIMWRGWHVLIMHRYSSAWLERYFKISLPISTVLFIEAVLVNIIAGIYATERASNSVTDIILSNTSPVDVDLIFVYGALAFIAMATLYLLTHPRRIPFTLSALALFWIIRAIFISLTHLGPYPDHAVIDSESRIILTIFGGGDEFFSAHTGAPFLLALVFWKEYVWRYIFLASSIFFGTIVLLGHLHYSIDVLSAFFITYCVYEMSKWMFPRERELFEAQEIAQIDVTEVV